VNWAKRLERRRPELIAIKEKPQDWNRLNIYDKVLRWFEVIEKELQKPVVLPENVYNMDETGVMLVVSEQHVTRWRICLIGIYATIESVACLPMEVGTIYMYISL
jgi:hypothetical protein